VSGGRPRTAIGTYGNVSVRLAGRRYVAETRFRDADGRLRKVHATAASRSSAHTLLKARLLDRPGYGRGGMLSLASPFGDLAALWLADLDTRELSEGTKGNYRDDLRRHVAPAFQHYTLGEITTGRVESFLKAEAQVSYSRAKHSRSLLNLLFGFAQRHDALARNPVEGTSPLHNPKGVPQALTLAQVAAIRAAAAVWRTGPGVNGPKPDGQVRDITEVLLGTALRIGEVLALRPCDIQDRPGGMTLRVRGTVVLRTGRGAVRQDRPKTEHSIRTIAVPEFAAAVLRRRLAGLGGESAEHTIFANRTGGPLSPFNVRRTFRDFLDLAGLADIGITTRWYRRTGATVIARGVGVDAAAAFLGHGSTAITEGHYIEPDRSVDAAPAAHLERTFRPVDPDGALLASSSLTSAESGLLALLDDDDPDSEP
jgi:integrase